MKKPYVIAEAGVNFFDTAKTRNVLPLEEALRYVDLAKEAGVDAIKFQSYKAHKLASKNSPAYWDTKEEPTLSQYELFKKYDCLEESDYRKLAEQSKLRGIDFLSTPFDYESADWLYDLVNAYKISSSDLSNTPFLKHIAKKGKPIILSVGASYISEIDEAVRVMKENGCPCITLLHCVLSYPCMPEDANLNMIKSIKKIFPSCKIGYSDHTKPDPTMAILTTAYMLGAETIEKHFTLDKTLPGNDHYHAGSPEDFAKVVKAFKLINVVLGQEEKTVLECEKIPRREARRSIVLNRDMKAGEIICEKDLTLKRPGTGIPPCYIEIIKGRKLNSDYAEDTVLTWEMV